MALIRLATTRDPAPYQSQERATLAEAIASAAEHAARLAATRAAVDRARDAVYTAAREIDPAIRAIEQAKVDATRFLVDQAAGNAGHPPISVRQCRDLLVDAEDRLAAAREAETALTAELSRVEAGAHTHQSLIRQAAIEVVRESGEVSALLRDVEALMDSLGDKAQALLLLARAGAIRDARLQDVGLTARLRQIRAEANPHYAVAGPAAVRRMFSTPGEWTPPTESASATAWAEAIDRLLSDPEAKLA